MNGNDELNEDIKKSIESIIGTNTKLIKKRKNSKEIDKEHFINIILSLEDINTRDLILNNEFMIDLTSYGEKYYEVIDNLITLIFGKELAKLIFFYLYERLNEDGTVKILIDRNGKKIQLNNPSDLYELIQSVKNES